MIQLHFFFILFNYFTFNFNLVCVYEQNGESINNIMNSLSSITFTSILRRASHNSDHSNPDDVAENVQAEDQNLQSLL